MAATVLKLMEEQKNIVIAYNLYSDLIFSDNYLVC